MLIQIFPCFHKLSNYQIIEKIIRRLRRLRINFSIKFLKLEKH